MTNKKEIIEIVKSPINLAVLIILSLFSAMGIIFTIYRSLTDQTVIILFTVSAFLAFLIFVIINNRHTEKITEQHVEDRWNIKVYDGIQKTYPDMDKILGESLEKGNTEIAVLGLTLYHMWEYSKNYLKKDTTSNLKLIFCAIDPYSFIIPNMNKTWAKHSENYINDIHQYIRENEKYLNRKGIDIGVYTYCHVPMIHGILINNHHLFLSYTKWTSLDKIEGAETFYVYYSLDTLIGKKHVEMFKTWINHIKRGKCQEICLKEIGKPMEIGEKTDK